MSFVLHRGNDLETLADRLAEVVAEPVGPPTRPEVLAVQSQGMERWVSQHLARRLGVWANARFLFPRNLVDHVLGQVLGEEREVGQPFSRESLTWAVAALLPDLVPEPAFAPLRTYLEGDDGGVRRLQLAQRLADLFDQYVVYRPDLVLAWERGQDDDWQALLWRALIRRGSGRHLADRAGECLARLAEAEAEAEVDLGDLPGRVTLFGISTLPPLFLRVLGGLSAHLDVHLLQLSPCKEYWADLRRSDETVTDANSLLASLGKVGRDFQTVLEDEVDYQEAPGDLYRDPLDGPWPSGAPTALATLQSDILHQRRRAASGGRCDPMPIAVTDDSLVLHSCHGPMREAEVLRDQLLALFDADPTLEPRHVLVMTPDIDAYAPYVDAAFGAAADLPYTIADQSLRREHPVVEAFGAVLDVLGGRFPASAVVDLLGHAAVRERFGLTDEDVDAARHWVAESGIRWGVDADHRAELGQPPYAENTWRFGLDRLLLAHAMPPDGRTLFAGTLPCGGVEGDRAGGLGSFADLCETLFDLRARLAAPRAVPAWRDALVEVLDRTVSVESLPLQHQLVREALERLADCAQEAQFDDPVALDAIRDMLVGGFDEPGGSAGFLAGGVTVCEMLPMRSIPFRVIALVGMNDETFPRRQRRLAFDRLADQPRAGDRSSGNDDRYQLLECLLAARERLWVTYVGQSSRDNSPLPPSVVVSEVLDAAVESCAFAPEHFVLRHPLQPFSPRYFDPADDARLFSFDRAQALGAARLQAARQPLARFLTRLVPPEPESESESEPDLALDALVRFCENPARALLTGQLGLILGDEVEKLEDREPMGLDGLARWQVGTRLLDEATERGGHRDPADLYPVVRADGVLPLGWPGRLGFEALLPGVEGLREKLDKWLAPEPLPALRVKVALERIRITGWLRGLRPRAQVCYRYGRLRAKDLVAAWVHHLALCAMGSGAELGLPDTTVLVGQAPRRAGQVDVRQLGPVPVNKARELLASLVHLYEAGQQVPLRIFPEPSLAYARTLLKAKVAEVADAAARAGALATAERAFTSTRFNRGDDTDAYVRQAHAGAEDLLAGEPPGLEGQELAFSDLAMAVFGPLLDHLQVINSE